MVLAACTARSLFPLAAVLVLGLASCDEERKANKGRRDYVSVEKMTQGGRRQGVLDTDKLLSRSQPSLEEDWREHTRHDLPGLGAQFTQEGIRRKVLVMCEGVQCTMAAGGATPNGEQLGFFFPYFVLDRGEDDKGRAWYEVGESPSRERSLGWCPESVVAPWNHRIGLRLDPPDETERIVPLLFYESLDGPRDLVSSGGAKADPIARVTPTSERFYQPWPILDRRTLEAPDGRVFTALQVAFLGRTPEDLIEEAAPPAADDAYTDQQFQGIITENRELEIHVVLDTTGSMGPYIDAAREAIKDLAARLRGMEGFKPRVRLQLVVYRDRGKGSDFVTRAYDFGRDFERFAGFLDRLEASGGGDAREAVFDAVLRGIEMDWGSSLSRRVLLLCGDCPGHEYEDSDGNPKKLSIERLVARARESHINIFALAVGAVGDSELRARCRQQWEQFSRGTGGKSFEIEEAVRVVRCVRDIFVANTREISKVEKWLRSQREGSRAGSSGDVTKETHIVEFLTRRGVSVERISKKHGVAFSTGWVLANWPGTPSVSYEVYMSRAELAFLSSTLSLLRSYTGANLGLACADGVLPYQTGDGDSPLAFFADESPEPLDIWLRSKGLPLNENSILRLSKRELVTMSEERRFELRERVADCVVLLDVVDRDKSAWRYRDGKEWTWLPQRLLP